MPRLRYVDEADTRIIVERLTATLFVGSPSFVLLGTSGRDRLQAALAQPRWPQYRDLPMKAAVLHYHLNKGHAYADGNKRLALVATDLFVLLNEGLVVATADELEALALGVADNSISPEENIAFFKERCFRFRWTEDRGLRWARGLSPAGRVALGGAASPRTRELAAAVRTVATEVQRALGSAGAQR